jgi:D-alanyl-D-alanine carboxypeptidase
MTTAATPHVSPSEHLARERHLRACVRTLLVGLPMRIYVPGQGAWTATFGTSDLGTHAPMDVHMHMRIGSITKALTGEVILQLADEGKLRLDDPVAKYQPAVPALTFLASSSDSQYTTKSSAYLTTALGPRISPCRPFL